MGITLDINLKWTGHIEAIKIKLQETLGVLCKTRHLLNEKALYLSSLILCLWAMFDMACCAGEEQIKNV